MCASLLSGGLVRHYILQRPFTRTISLMIASASNIPLCELVCPLIRRKEILIYLYLHELEYAGTLLLMSLVFMAQPLFSWLQSTINRGKLHKSHLD